MPSHPTTSAKIILAQLNTSGWSIFYTHLQLVKGQARYTGTRNKIPWWSGRYRICYELGGGSGFMARCDATDGGWMAVTGGEAKVTTTFTGGEPFPLEQIENTGVSGYYQYQAITMDVNFTILGLDSSTCQEEWGIPFNAWFAT